MVRVAEKKLPAPVTKPVGSYAERYNSLSASGLQDS